MRWIALFLLCCGIAGAQQYDYAPTAVRMVANPSGSGYVPDTMTTAQAAGQVQYDNAPPILPLCAVVGTNKFSVCPPGGSDPLAMPRTGGNFSGAINATSVGGELKCDQFPGNDPAAKLRACESQAQTNSQSSNLPVVCDARMFTGTQSMLSQVEVYPHTVLLLPHSANWVWDIQDGTSVGLLQDDSSAIVGTSPAGGDASMQLKTGSNNTNMLALYATADASTSGADAYVYASGFGTYNYFAGAKLAHGLVYTRKLFDESRFERIGAFNPYGDAWHVYGVCCDTEFVQIQASSGYGVQGGVPFTVEDGTSVPAWGSSFVASGSFNSAGTGKPNILILPGNNQITFATPYVETEVPGTSGTQGQSDNTAPVVDNQSSAAPHFIGGGLIVNNNKPIFSHPYQAGLIDFWSNQSLPTLNGAMLNFPTFGPDSNGGSYIKLVDSSGAYHFEIYTGTAKTQFQSPNQYGYQFVGPAGGSLLAVGNGDTNVRAESGYFGSVFRTPSSSSDSCQTGDFWDDASFHYVCVATNSIKRVALNAF